MGVSAPATDLAGWTPIRVHWRGEPVVEWAWLDGVEFTDPFFVRTVERSFRRPFSLLFRRETPIEALAELEPGLDPNGFVFHVSRCGSTLVAQVLAAVPEHLVLSEPLPVDGILRAPAPEADRVRWLRLIVSMLGLPRRGCERGYVLKLDAWNACSLATVRRAFPETPWVFLHLDPVEVLASHRRQRGAHMVPGAIDSELFGLDPASAISHEEYGARVLAAIYRAGLENRDDHSLFVDYRELPDAVLERIAPWFGLEFGEDARARMDEVGRFDAKSPQLLFQQEELLETPALREAAERWARPVYEELLAC